MKRFARTGSIVVVALAAAGFRAFISDTRIETRVDARVRNQVAAIADSLTREGVTAEPMIQSALEGTLKGADPKIILNVAHKWAYALRRSKTLLGPAANDAEVSAGAQALRAGVQEAQLLRFKDARTGQRYASALSTIAYLVTKGVPADTASTVLVNVVLASANDVDIRTLQEEIERDINGGTPPGLAAVAREKGLIDAINAARDTMNGVVPGTALPSTRGTARPADPMANGGSRGSAVGNQGTGSRPPAPRGKDKKRP